MFYMERKVDRNRIDIKKLTDADRGYVQAGFAERLSMVWELTREVWSLTGKDAEQRLQRDVAKLIRQ